MLFKNQTHFQIRSCALRFFSFYQFILIGVLISSLFGSPPGSQTLRIPRLHHATVVTDGVLDEWQGVKPLFNMGPANVDSLNFYYHGEADAQCQIFSQWDMHHLYLGFKVADDFVFNELRYEDLYVGDGIELVISSTDSSQHVEQGRLDLHLLLVPRLEKEEGLAWVVLTKNNERLYGDGNAYGIRTGTVITQGGYQIELSLPWAVLDSLDLSHRPFFKIGFQVNDADSSRQRETILRSVSQNGILYYLSCFLEEAETLQENDTGFMAYRWFIPILILFSLICFFFFFRVKDFISRSSWVRGLIGGTVVFMILELMLVGTQFFVKRQYSKKSLHLANTVQAIQAEAKSLGLANGRPAEYAKVLSGLLHGERHKSSSGYQYQAWPLTVPESQPVAVLEDSSRTFHSLNGIPYLLNRQIIGYGGSAGKGMRSCRIPIQNEADRLCFLYTSSGYQLERGSPYGSRIGSLRIHYQDQTEQLIELRNGINIDSYWLGTPDKHPPEMTSLMGFYIQEGAAEYHLDEFIIDLKAVPIEWLEIEDQKTWDQIVVRGISLGKKIAQAAGSARPDFLVYFNLQDEQLSLKEEWLKELKGSEIIFYQKTQQILTPFFSHVFYSRLPAHLQRGVLEQLKEKQEWIKSEDVFYATSFLPLNYFDLARLEEAGFGCLGLFLPVQSLNWFEKMIKGMPLVWFVLLFFAGLKIIADRAQQMARFRFKLLFFYLSVFILPILILYFFLSRILIDLERDQVVKQLDFNFKLIEKILAKQKILLKEAVTSQRKDSTILSSQEIRSFTLAERVGYHSVTGEWKKEYSATDSKAALFFNPFSLSTLNSSGLGVNGWWGIYQSFLTRKVSPHGTETVYQTALLDRIFIKGLSEFVQCEVALYYPNGALSYGTSPVFSERSLRYPALLQKKEELLASGRFAIKGIRVKEQKKTFGFQLLLNDPGQPVGILALTDPDSKLPQRPVWFKLLFLGIALIGFSFANYLTFSAKLDASVQKLRAGQTAVQAEKLGYRTEEGEDELGEFGTAFNALVKNLEERILELSLMNEFSTQLSILHKPHRLAEFGLATILRAVKAKEGSILLNDFKNGSPHFLLRMGEAGISRSSGIEINLKDLSVFKKSDDPVHNNMVYVSSIKFKNFVSGEISLSRDGEPFTERDVKFCSTLINHLSVALENARLYHLAVEDILPGLYSRHYFLQLLEREIQDSRYQQKAISLLLVQIGQWENSHWIAMDSESENFKNIVQSLLRIIGSAGICARFQESELAVLFSGKNKNESRNFCEQILAQFKEESGSSLIGGIASIPDDTNSQQILLIDAGQALAEARQHPRNSFIVYGERGVASVEDYHGVVPDVVIVNEKMREMASRIFSIAKSESTVLLEGESGSGKDFWASYIHHASDRKDNPFVKIHCPAIPHELFYSELFGHEKGAFTGAKERKIGKFEHAQGGTIYLNEIGDLSLENQAKFLSVIQERRFSRLGDSHTIPLDVRLIFSTAKNLEEAIRENRFRQDLYYRLNVLQFKIFPLRERREDIPELARIFMKKYGEREGRVIYEISGSLMDKFIQYDWPGNVRELENLIERAVVMLPPDKTAIDDIPEFSNKMLAFPAIQFGQTQLTPRKKSQEERLEEILRYLREHKSINSRQYSQIFNVTTRTAQLDLNVLVLKNRILKKGTGFKNTYYSIKEEI